MQILANLSLSWATQPIRVWRNISIEKQLHSSFAKKQEYSVEANIHGKGSDVRNLYQKSKRNINEAYFQNI